MKYAGIGSRDTPLITLELMTVLAAHLRERGMMLRSGGARGADTAFYNGVRSATHAEVFYADHATPEAFDHAAKYHPAWEKCNGTTQVLHARNSMIMLGRYLNDPVDFVVCWTPGGQAVRGTGQALRIAKAYEIPVFNYGDNSIYGLSAWLEGRIA